MKHRAFRPSRRIAVAGLVAVVVAVGAVVGLSLSGGATTGTGTVQTAWGPLTPADRDLLGTVRRTCLWEVSTLQQAQERASSPAVREVARRMLAEHVGLDEKARRVADQLGVASPGTADAEQIAWTGEISAATGPTYDRVVVQRLREADGAVLPIVQEARVGTANDLVRVFSRDTLEHLTRHVGYLEGTGLVDYSALPESPPPGTTGESVNARDLVLPGLTVLACLTVAVWSGVALRRRHRSARTGTTPVEVALGFPGTADDRK